MKGKPRILVVDDEPNLCLLYKQALEGEGYQVDAVPDAQDALRLLEERPPDVVVMDVRMPRMDGIEAMGRMLSRRNDLHIILNTAYGSHKDDFRSWPADAYIIKSSDLGPLKLAIRSSLSPAVPTHA